MISRWITAHFRPSASSVGDVERFATALLFEVFGMRERARRRRRAAAVHVLAIVAERDGACWPWPGPATIGGESPRRAAEHVARRIGRAAAPGQAAPCAIVVSTARSPRAAASWTPRKRSRISASKSGSALNQRSEPASAQNAMIVCGVTVLPLPHACTHPGARWPSVTKEQRRGAANETRHKRLTQVLAPPQRGTRRPVTRRRGTRRRGTKRRGWATRSALP